MNIKGIIRKLLGKSSPYVTVAQLRAKGAEVGENVTICTRKIDLNHGFLLSIGNRVTLSDCRLLLHDGSTKRELGYSRIGRIVIGDDVFIGADAIILPGVHIGDHVIVGAGAVVTKDIPSGSVAAGSPARVVCTYESFIQRNKEMMNQVPVYNTSYTEKTAEEISKMKKDLKEHRYGFDI